MTLPSGANTYHSPPKVLSFCPLVSPGALSPVNVYRGRPAISSCRVPSGRVSIPSFPVIPAGCPGNGFGAATIGHSWRQAPAHADLVDVSGSNMYTVLPSAVVSTVPGPVLAVFRTAAPALELEPDEPAPVLVELPELLPHAARNNMPAPMGKTNSDLVGNLIIASGFHPHKRAEGDARFNPQRLTSLALEGLRASDRRRS